MSDAEMTENDMSDAETPNRLNARKVREGIVISTRMDKTAVIKVVDRVRHPRYRKTLQRTTKFYAHDETNDVREGDRVRIQETRPLSKLKRWRVVEVLERAR
jgi:small subunit ribosomal protein S17